MQNFKPIKENAADRDQRERLERERALASAAKVPNIIIAVLFCLMIGGMAVLHFAIPDRSFSESENRVLQTAPEFSANSLFSGEFGADVKDYLSDQFPFRDAFITVKAATETVLLRQENGGVMIKGDTLTARDSFPNGENLAKNLISVLNFTFDAEEAGIPVIFAPAGRREDVCVKDLPLLYGTGASEDLWNAIEVAGADIEKFGGTFVNLRAALLPHAEAGEAVYYRTDHHWTTLGAYYAYLAVWDALPEDLTKRREPLSMDEFTKVTVTDDFRGTSAASSGASWIKPDKIEMWRYSHDNSLTVTVGGKEHSGLYYEEYLAKRDKYSFFLGENVARLEITDKNATRRPTIIVVKDSFAQCFVPFLAADFNIVMIDPRYSTESVYRLAREINASAVLILANAETLTDATDFARLVIGTPVSSDGQTSAE